MTADREQTRRDAKRLDAEIQLRDQAERRVNELLESWAETDEADWSLSEDETQIVLAALAEAREGSAGILAMYDNCKARVEQAERQTRTERGLREDAERERDKAQDRWGQAERERDEFSLKYSRTAHDLIEAEARLASVPTLVEALRLARRDIGVVQRAGWDSTRLQFATEAVGRIDDALTVYEQSQGKP